MIQIRSASDNIFDCIRESCRNVADRATRVRIDYSRISSYAASLPVEKVTSPQLDPDCHYLGKKGLINDFFLGISLPFSKVFYQFYKQKKRRSEATSTIRHSSLVISHSKGEVFL